MMRFLSQLLAATLSFCIALPAYCSTDNRLTNLSVTNGGAMPVPIASYAYTVDNAGHRTGVTELSGRAVNGYDNLYRLTNETISNDPNAMNGAVSYVYDAVGNRTQKVSTLPGYPGGLTNYNANDQIGTDTYDAEGNTTASNGTGYVYDFENHLIQANGITYVYDGDGNRVSKTVAGVTTTYLVDDQNPTGYAQVLQEQVQQSGVYPVEYVYGLEQFTRFRRFYDAGGNFNRETIFYEHDGHGSVRSLTDGSGTVLNTYDYDAFGNLIHSTGTTQNNFLFAGEQFDPDLGLYYNRARYLNTGTGRFWTMDTDEPDDWEPLSLHRYLYTGNDPVDRIDPSGHDFDLGSLSVAVAVGGTIDAITALRAHEALAGVAKSFLIGSLKGAVFFLAGGAAFRLLATAGQAAASLEAVQAASEFLGNVISRVGPLYEGLQLPVRFSVLTNVGEVFVKDNATKHLATEILAKAGTTGATKLAAALAIDEIKALVEQEAVEGLESIAGKRITTTLAGRVVQITIEKQPGQAVAYAITHLVFM